MNFTALLVAAALLAQQTIAPITGEVIDDHGRPIPGAEVVFSPGEARDGSVAILAKTTTSETGRFRLERPGAVRSGCEVEGAIWAASRGWSWESSS